VGAEYTMAEQAIMLHEVFKSLTEAGFTEDQALKVIAITMTGKATE